LFEKHFFQKDYKPLKFISKNKIYGGVKMGDDDCCG